MRSLDQGSGPTVSDVQQTRNACGLTEVLLSCLQCPIKIIARIKLTYCAAPTLIQKLYEQRNGPATIDTKERLIQNEEASHEEAKNGKGSCQRLFSGFLPEFRVFVV
jgi:hypothetical protein